jgi:hypothetical protein
MVCAGQMAVVKQVVKSFPSACTLKREQSVLVFFICKMESLRTKYSLEATVLQNME